MHTEISSNDSATELFDSSIAMSSETTLIVLANTQVTPTDLVPEIRLRLFDQDGPWGATGQSLFTETGPHPYWAFAWGSGQAMARYLLDHPATVDGRRVLDFGAGSGIVSIAAARAGASHVTASEIDPIAIEAIRLNAELNRVSIETCVGKSPAAREYDVIIMCDAFYHWPGNEFTYLPGDASEQLLVAIPNFRGLARGREFPRNSLKELAQYEVRTVPDLEVEAITRATIYSWTDPETPA